MICDHCGHDNPAENHYCGICGTALERRPAAVAAHPGSVSERLRALTEDEQPKDGRNNSEAPEPRRAAVPSFLGLEDAAPRRPPKSSSGISGPSFLGLETPPERASYLLDDEEPQSHWRGYLAALLIVVVAILAGLQWRAEVKTEAYKIGTMLWARMHASSAQPNVSEKVAGGTPPEMTPPPSPENPPQPSATSNLAPAGETTPPAIGSGAPASPSSEAAATIPQPTASSDAGKSAGNISSATDQQRPSATAKTDKAMAASSRNPAPANDQQRADALLLMAQKYLHGLGVPRDCDQGLVYLREAVRQPSAPARSQMGALYATGTCVPQNRVEAYRWFSSAMEVEPTNPWLGRERDTLYGEMTAAERKQLNQ